MNQTPDRDETSFELLPGAPDSPVILHVPHSYAGARIRRRCAPESRSTSRAGAGVGPHHRHARRRLAAAAARAARVSTEWRMELNRLSRLVVDPERFPDEREGVLSVGMGAVYTRTTRRAPLRPADADPRPLIERYFHPYAAAMTAAVADRLAVGRGGR